MRNKMKKTLAIMLTITMIMSLFGSFVIMGNAASPDDDKTEYPKYNMEDGALVVEFEDAFINSANVKVESSDNASGGKSVRFLNVNSTQPAADASADVGIELTFDKDGKYYFWVRYLSPDSDSDTAWVDYGAEAYRTRERGYAAVTFTVLEGGKDYQWKKLGAIYGKAGQTQTVRLSTREKNFVADKLIVSGFIGYAPEGMGEKPDSSATFKPLKMPENLYPIPGVTPPPEHPRVLFRASDIPQIKKNMEHPEMAELVKIFNTLKGMTYTGDLEPTDPNYDAKGLEIIAAKALDYAFYGNEENGKQAIDIIKKYAATLDVTSTGDKCRQLGHTLRYVGIVYDWCYPLLSTEDKAELMFLAQMISADMEVGFPPDGQTMICGHGAEWQLYRDWLTLSIAAYDEYPDAYNMVVGKILSPESVDYRNWWNQSHTHSQGSSYGSSRYAPELQAHITLKRMCGYELFNEDDLVQIAYDWIYRRRPDGTLMIDGDDNTNTTTRGAYTSIGRDAFFLSYVISKDPIVKRAFFYNGGFLEQYSREAVQPIEKMLLNDPNVKADVAIETLPLTLYNPSPVGEMIARTGWGLGTKSPDVIATMNISEYNPMNHGHYECGHFMIYYKGILANDSGWYEMHNSAQQKNYMAQTAAHNTLLIETDYNKYGNQNQGIDGQGADSDAGKNFYWIDSKWEQYQNNEQNHWADVIGHEYGPDVQYPEYSYLAGDIANAYTSEYDDGVNEALRHMIFLPTGDEKNPAAFVVFDKIDTKVGGQKKAFLLHSQEEPEVNGNVTTIKRTEYDYNGKLVNQTLLPKADNLKIEKIGGAEFADNGKVIVETDKRFWNKGRSWYFLQDDPDIKLDLNTSGRTVMKGSALESGWGRVEIMPAQTGNVDYMLNVMYVGDADGDSTVKEATLIETDAFVGAKIFDRVAVFNKNKARTKDTVTFTVPGDESALKVNVAGLMAGTWKISVNGNDIDTQIASEDGGIIYFTAPAGEYKITYVNADANKQFADSGAPELEGVSIFLNNNFLYSDVAPTIRDGRTLLPMRALLEAAEAKVSWDEATATATAVADGGLEIKITENQKTAYVNGNPVELDVPAMIINGRFVIPVRFVAENLGFKVSWDELSSMVKLTQPQSQKGLGVENYIRIMAVEQSGAEANPARQIEASCDGSFGSYWGVSSADGADVWGIYDLGSVKTLDQVMFSFMQSHVRKYKFDIEVSEDGVNYTPVLVGMETSGDAPTSTLEKFDLGGVRARYVKYRGYGNTVNMWNSMCEIVFTEKK